MAVVLIEILILYSAFYLPGLLWQTGFTGSEIPGLTLYILRYLTVAVPQTFLVLYVIRIQKKLKFRDFGIIRLRISDIPAALLVYTGILLLVFTLGLMAAALPYSAKEILTSGFRWKLDRLSQVPIVIAFCITIGYSEEIFFRAYLLTRLEQIGASVYAAIAVSSILFGIGHLYQGYMGLIVALTEGIYFSFIFHRKRNVHLTAIAHSLYNFTVLIVSLYVINPLS